MYTANTMATAIEALGLSLPYSSSTPAEDPGKKEECRRAGVAVLELLQKDLKPRDIVTKKSFENALVIVMAVGGSTNAVLHLIAMAKAADIALSLDDFQRASERVPLLADLKPSGTYVQEDLHEAGGTPALMRYLLEKGFLHGDCMNHACASARRKRRPRTYHTAPPGRPGVSERRSPGRRSRWFIPEGIRGFAICSWAG